MGNSIPTIPEEYVWMVASGFVIAFILAFGLGANDCANSFGTSVGSGVLTLRMACILGSIFETLGAIFLGARVSDTIRKGIIDVTDYNGTESELLVGNVATLGGSCVWLLAASILRLPVSGTHSIVGASLGFALVARGAKGINWPSIGKIIGSWFVSPVLSGIVSVLCFFFLKKIVLDKEDPLEAGLKIIPFFYFITVAVNAFSIFYSKSTLFGFDKIPLYGVFILTLGIATIVALVIHFFVGPRIRRSVKSLLEKEANENIERDETTAADDNKNREGETRDGRTRDGETRDGETQESVFISVPDGKEPDTNGTLPKKENVEEESVDSPTKDAAADTTLQDTPQAAALFKFLQILTAVFGAFTHGGNDVSNAIAPLIGLWLVSTTGEVVQEAETPIWLLAYGGVGISVGLWVLGRRVIQTIGKDLTTITPSSGFSIELGSALTVLIATNIGIPISSTHCKVGSVVTVGRFRSKEGLKWKVIRNILFAWFVTLPVTCGISAGAFYGLKHLI